jgi:hypothetical protein
VFHDPTRLVDFGRCYQPDVPGKSGAADIRGVVEGPVYLLTQDKAGSKMKISESDRFSDIPIQGGPDGVINGKNCREMSGR